MTDRRTPVAALRPAIWATLAAGAVLASVGRTTGGLALILLGVLRAHLVLDAPIDARIDRGTERVARNIGSFIGHALLSIVAVVVLVPAGALCRAFGVDPIRRAPDAWQIPMSSGPVGRGYSGGRAAAADRPAPPASSRPVRVLRFAALVLLMLAVAGALQAVHLPHRVSSRSVALPGALSDQPQARQMEAEEGEVFARLRPDPVVGWKLPRSEPGSLVSVRQGVRTTSGPAHADRRPVIWMFGGSALWGSGQRDGYTIASALSNQLAARGTPAVVVNRGVFAYTAAQEARAFAVALEHEPPPDLVIFYDGYNDVEVGMSSQLQGVPPGSQTVAPLEALRRNPVLFRASGPVARTTSARVEGVLSAYRRAMAAARTTARAVGIPVVQVWQPSVFTREPTPVERRTLERLGFDRFMLDRHQDLNQRIRDGLPASVVDLADSLDDAPTVFIDQVHTNEVGAHLVARALLEDLDPQLARLGT